MAEALLLTSSDLFPLRSDLSAMEGALQAVEDAIVAQYRNEIRHYNIVDRRPGEFEGIRIALSAGDKVLSGMRIFGNPPHTRAFMLFDGETRAILAFMDYGVLNSLRVGAIGGVAARHLAPANPKVLGFIGSGWQAPPQVNAVRRGAPDLELIKVFSPTKEHRESFARQMAAQLEMAVEPVESVQEALLDADIVDLCAPGHFDLREPLFEPDWVKPGALVISMAPSQCKEEFVESARVVAVSYENLTQEPAARPPYDSLVRRGVFTKDNVTRMGAVITEGARPRRSPEEHVIYQLEGGTAQDLFVATWGYEWARSKGLGKPFDLSA